MMHTAWTGSVGAWLLVGMAHAAEPALPGVERPDDGLTRALSGLAAQEGLDGPYANRLVGAISPFLVQQGDSPTNWSPWGQDALERARETERPVLLLVGHGSCRPCRMMAEESFADPELAAWLNARFVPVLVDARERPDLDAAFAFAGEALGGSVDHPRLYALTPDGAPFFASGYLPPRDGDRGRGRGLHTVLDELDGSWSSTREAVEARAADVLRQVRGRARVAHGDGLPDARFPDLLRDNLVSSFDEEWGGFGTAPKAPAPELLGFLLRYAALRDDARAAGMTRHTLVRLAAGGIRDQVGGGFHVDSTDRRWHVPHFEKRLVDNAELVSAYLEALQFSGEPGFGEVADETLRFMVRTLRDEVGPFHAGLSSASLDPDGQVTDGAFYTWTWAELGAAVGGADQHFASSAWGLLPGDRGRRVLRGRSTLSSLADEFQMGRDDVAQRLDTARRRLYFAREERPHPLRDDQVLAGENGLAISAFAQGGRILGEPAWTTVAEELASFVLDQMVGDDGRTRRTWRDGRAAHAATAYDLAAVTQGLLDLYEATGERRWLDAAIERQQELDTHHGEPLGGWYLTPDDAPTVVARLRPASEHDTAMGNGIAAHNSLRLAYLTGDAAHLRRALRAFEGFSDVLERSPLALPRLAQAWTVTRMVPRQVVLVVGEDGPGALGEVLDRSFLPHVVRVVGDQAQVDAVADRVPFAAGRRAAGRTTAWVCEAGDCSAPIVRADDLAEALRIRVEPRPADNAGTVGSRR